MKAFLTWYGEGCIANLLSSIAFLTTTIAAVIVLAVSSGHARGPLSRLSRLTHRITESALLFALPRRAE